MTTTSDGTRVIMVNSQTKTLALLVGLLAATATLSVAQSGPQTNADELHLKSDEQQQQQGANNLVAPDTTVITDADTTPNGINDNDNDNGKQQQQQQQQNGRPRPHGPLDHLMPPSLFGGFGSPFGSLFGPSTPTGSDSLPPYMRPHRQPLFHSILGGGIFDVLNRHSQDLEREFSNLERQAGEGKDVSYFNRNGVAYVRTCTTRRVSPDGEKQQTDPQLIPADKQIDGPQDSRAPLESRGQQQGQPQGQPQGQQQPQQNQTQGTSIPQVV